MPQDAGQYGIPRMRMRILGALMRSAPELKKLTNIMAEIYMPLTRSVNDPYPGLTYILP
jgi:hypothetical protein